MKISQNVCSPACIIENVTSRVHVHVFVFVFVCVCV